MALIFDFANTRSKLDELSKTREDATDTAANKNLWSTLTRMRKTAIELLGAELELLKNELQEEFTAEVIFTRRIILASAVIIVGVSLSAVGLLVLLSKFIPLWLSAITLGALLTIGGVVFLTTAWKRHASLSRIADHLHESLDWSDLVK